MIQLDWMAYWQEFKRVHGDPVLHAGRCLFPDGWTHSASSELGPEWPPPDDARALKTLQTAYWTERLRIVREERDALRDEMKSLERLQATRSATLQHRGLDHDEDTGKVRAAVKPLDLKSDQSPQVMRLVWLVGDIDACEDRLEELAGKQDGQQRAG